MLKHRVRSFEEALAYITDCNLATVCSMAGKKNRPKHEFERQISIAQTGVDWLLEMGADVSTTQAADVIFAGSVAKWAEQFIPATTESGE